MKEYRLSLPVIEYKNIWFRIVFERPDLQKNSYQQRVVGQRLVDGWVEGVVESQKEILELVHIDPKISKSEMSEKIGISTTAIDKNIDALKKKGLLKRIGSAKGGHWKIIEKDL